LSQKETPQETNCQKIDLTIPVLSEGETKQVTNIGGNYVLSDIETSSKKDYFNADYIQRATYDAQRLNHIYSSVLDKQTSSYVTTMDELTSLAQNTQTSIDKIKKINGIVKYYINKEDLIGRVVETIENNINTNYKIEYPSNSGNGKKGSKLKKELKMESELKVLIDKFNEQINIPKLIATNAVTTYTEGNYIFYLMGDSEGGYSLVNYPLDITEITPMKIDDDPIIAFNVTELSSRLQESRTKYGKLKTNKLIDIEKTIEDEIKKCYPSEVYDAYKGKDQLALLNPQKVGLNRINNLKGLYGLTPIFKALAPQLMLETVDKSDQKVLIQKTKKIYFQSTSSEIIERPDAINMIGHAHVSLLEAMSKDTIIYTGDPQVDDLKLIEPKTDLTDEKVKSGYKLRILEALGISFISSEGSKSITTTKINYSELLKVVNRITKGLEPIINKYYQLICEENGFPIEYSPKITIESTELLDLETKLKIADILYSKIGLSFDTVLNTLGLDYEIEKAKREKENDEGASEIFTPYLTSYVANSDATTKDKTDNETNSNGSKKSQDVDKQESDKQRQESLDV
jgi:hypothetical protein